MKDTPEQTCAQVRNDNQMALKRPAERYHAIDPRDAQCRGYPECGGCLACLAEQSGCDYLTVWHEVCGGPSCQSYVTELWAMLGVNARIADETGVHEGEAPRVPGWRRRRNGVVFCAP